MTDEKTAKAFYKELTARWNDAHLTVEQALPDIAALIKAVRRMERKRCEAVCWAESKHWRAIERDAKTDFNRHYAEASALTAERIASALPNADQPGAETPGGG